MFFKSLAAVFLKMRSRQVLSLLIDGTRLCFKVSLSKVQGHQMLTLDVEFATKLFQKVKLEL